MPTQTQNGLIPPETDEGREGGRRLHLSARQDHGLLHCTDVSRKENERLLDYIDDPRFKGVYLLLDLLMPEEEAQNLRKRLIVYAANSGGPFSQRRLHQAF